MSSPRYETPEELIRKIKILAEDMLQNKVTFMHEGKIYSFYADTKGVEVKVDGEKSYITLQEFGEKYNASGLTDLFQTLVEHYSIIQSV